MPLMVVTQRVDRVLPRELRRAEALHEHAADEHPMLLHAFEHGVQSGKTSRNVFLVDQRRGDDAVAVQQ